MFISLDDEDVELLLEAVRIAREAKEAAWKQARAAGLKQFVAQDFGIPALDQLFQRVADAYNGESGQAAGNNLHSR